MTKFFPYTVLGIGAFALWYDWKYDEYFDTRADIFPTLESDSVALSGPIGVAEYRGALSLGDTLELILQRAIFHAYGRRQWYSETLWLNLGEPEETVSKGPFAIVLSVEGDTLCAYDREKNGGYALSSIMYLPEELVVIGLGGVDTIHLRLHRQLQPFPAEPPDIPWWAEPLRVMTSR
jgi:hypothetical protein